MMAVALSVSQVGMAATKTTRPMTYSPGAITSCLSRHGAISGVISFAHPKAEYRKLLPSGLVSEVTVMPGFGPKIDEGALYFFRTDALAVAGVSKLVRTFVFFRDLPPDLEVLLTAGKKPPPADAARNLHRLARNVVVIWHYPRKHVASSDKLVNACIARK